MSKSLFTKVSENQYVQTLWEASYRLVMENHTFRASALSFTTILAIVPFLSVIVAFISLFPIFTQWINRAEVYLIQNYLPTSQDVIEHYFQGFIHQASSLPILSILFLIYTAISLMITVEETLNEVWQKTPRKKSLLFLFLNWLVLIALPLLLGLGVIISSYLFSLKWMAGYSYGFEAILLLFLPFTLNTCIFSTLYKVTPNTFVSWRAAFQGGIFASLLLEGGKKAFALYILKFPSYELIYGALASIPLFLIWIYVSWLIIIFGALITCSLSKREELANKLKNIRPLG